MNEENIYDLADLFKVFGDSTRIRILYKLVEGEMSVGELTESLGMTQSAISHQLKILKQSDLVKVKRDKQSMLYSLADDHVESILKIGMDHILEEDED